MASDLNDLKVSVWRSSGPSGAYEDFVVPAQESQTVLDVVAWVQQNQDPTLSYRYACRVGMCGSCAMMVNGQPRWTCRTHIQRVLKDNRVRIGPLRNLPVIKDLVTDMDPFFDKWTKAEAAFKPSTDRRKPIEKIDPQSPQRLAANAAVECINCAVCYAACDVVSNNEKYLGPAALNRAWTLQNDSRDAGHKSRLAAVTAADGCHNCHSQSGCATYCPNELNPTQSIAGLKKMSLMALLGMGASDD